MCENTPYSYKSDVWAVGCVLYELCTLKHAFTANNLLGLVYKIVQDKHAPIPDCYSTNMKQLVGLLLTKNHKQRPSVDEILRIPFMKEIAINFINKHSKGKITESVLIPIKKTEYHKDKVEEEMFKGMTPSQIMKKKKELKAQRRAEELKRAARENLVDNRSKVKMRKHNNMKSTMDRTKQNPMEYSSKSKQFYGGGTIKTEYFPTGQYNDVPTKTIETMNLNSKNDILTIFKPRICINIIAMINLLIIMACKLERRLLWGKLLRQ